MSTRATGTFEVKSWDEKTYEELEGAGKLTRASVAYSYKGEIEGEGQEEFLMMYPDEKSARFVEMQRIVGSVGGAQGVSCSRAVARSRVERRRAHGRWCLGQEPGSCPFRPLWRCCGQGCHV